jgi:alanyl-tRNA synthetase
MNMSTTERLYYEDSHLTVFEATVLSVTDRVSNWTGVTLDRTAFYPTGGGQPSDTGYINSARVVECVDHGEHGILHLIEGETPRVGEKVTGKIDWPVRLDHLQQHTGQHILSQAFVALYGAETRGFRMMTDVSEIDLALESPSDGRIQAAVEHANEIIWSNRPLIIHNITSEQAALLPLRKDSSREGRLRVIEIENFDMSPCGGTHAQQTGEVGLIAVRSWERAKSLTRVTFLAGGRALADYNRANSAARSVAAMFSTGRDEAAGLVSKVLNENKQLSRRISALEAVTTGIEAEELLKAALHIGDMRVVSQIFEMRDSESLKRLALALVASPQTVALLASKDNGTARLIFARSSDASGDMNGLTKVACATLDGRGGGNSDLAQGGGRKVEKLEEVLWNTINALKQV